MSETSLPTCYRHPDRETRLSCTSCERPICTECMTSAAVGQRCPECAKPSGRSRVIPAGQALRGARGATPVVTTIIVLCVIVFVPMALLEFTPLPNYVAGFGVQANWTLQAGQYWRLVTSMFLHSPAFLLIGHIGLNMLLLWLLGPPIEREAGPWAFASLYLGSGLVGNAAFFFLAPLGASALGASGAVFGLIGAWLAASVRNRHTLQGSAMLRQIGLLAAINIVFSFAAPNIAWQAHVGGFLAGFAIAYAWGRLRRQQTGARVAVGAAVGLLAVLAVVAASV